MNAGENKPTGMLGLLKKGIVKLTTLIFQE